MSRVDYGHCRSTAVKSFADFRFRSFNRAPEAIRLSRRALAADGEVAASAALHLLYRPGRAEVHGGLDDAEVVETQQTEKPMENVYHGAVWHKAPKTQNRNRVR